MKQSLLLTATVTPQAKIGGLSIRDTAVRFGQYEQAFRTLVDAGTTRHFSTIYVVENSDFDVERFRDAFRGAECHVELVGVAPHSSMGEFGRGFAEVCLIDDGLKNARARSELASGHLFWKLTGRYVVRNINDIVTRAFPNTDLVVNLRRYPKPWCDMFLMAFNDKSWTAVMRQADRLKESGDGPRAEQSMYEIVTHLSESDGVRLTPRLPAEPHLVGRRGWDNHEYDSGKQRIKRLFRQTMRVVAPGVYV